MTDERDHEPCPHPWKVHFRTGPQAAQRLAQIQADPDPWREENPTRYYQCECGGWALTGKKTLRSLARDTRRYQEEKRMRRHRR